MYEIKCMYSNAIITIFSLKFIKMYFYWRWNRSILGIEWKVDNKITSSHSWNKSIIIKMCIKVKKNYCLYERMYIDIKARTWILYFMNPIYSEKVTSRYFSYSYLQIYVAKYYDPIRESLSLQAREYIALGLKLIQPIN